jgi:hypothetical protein
LATIPTAGGVRDLRGLYAIGDCSGPDNGDSPVASARCVTTMGLLRISRIPLGAIPDQDRGYTLSGVTSLGEDPRGELYITTLGGRGSSKSETRQTKSVSEISINRI